jgi:predicted DNA-binding transcriptional regulator AlpA
MEINVPQVKPSAIPGFSSDKEFAAQIKKTTRTTWRWRKLGLGPKHIKIGKSVYYSHLDISAWLEELRTSRRAVRGRGGNRGR